MASTEPFEIHSTVTVNTYGPPGTEDTQEQRRGRVTRSVVTTQQTHPVAGMPRVHTTDFDYDILTRRGLVYPLPLVKKKVEPGRGYPLELHTAYAYDFRGNKTTTTECQNQFPQCEPGVSIDPGTVNAPFRTSVVSYNPAHFNAPQGPGALSSLGYTQLGRFPVRMTNPKGQVEYVAYDPVHGGLRQRTAVDGLHTCFGFDEFGRKNRELERCGTFSIIETTVQQYLAPSGTPGEAIVTVTRPPTGADSWAYSDVLGRVVRTRVRGFSGDIIETESTSYDAEGRVARR
jgi:hypothetical protein